MASNSPLVRAAIALSCLAASGAEALAQQPQLRMAIRNFPPQANTSLVWTLTSRLDDVYALLVDVSAGNGSLLGVPIELSLSPAALLVHVGVIGALGSPSASFPLVLPPGALPPGLPFFTQAVSLDPNQGIGSALVSNIDSFAAHSAPDAIVVPFTSGAGFTPLISGVYDTSVQTRLQALPPSTRLVRTVPTDGLVSPVPFSGQPLHPSGSRVQMVVRAADLGTVGVPETLMSVRWRPLFGGVVPEILPQFELLAARTDVVPDYAVDPFSALPAFPQSGLSPQFDQNPLPNSQVSLFSGSYSVQPQNLLANGYLPFPVLQQSFVYDGQSSLLLETRCAATLVGGPPVNFGVPYLMVVSSPLPFGTVVAAAGYNGQPAPVVPQSTPVGFGGSFLFDWQLELRRTRSTALSMWFAGPGNRDYQAPIVAAFTPPGTSISIEYRGNDCETCLNPTPWSSSPDIADGRAMLQFRVVMEANPLTGAVPWIDTLIVPVH